MRSFGFYMHHYVRLFSVVLPQQFLHSGSLVVRHTKRDVAVHEYVKLDGIVVADASCPQIVRLLDIWHRPSQLQNLLFHLVGKGLFHQVAYTASKQVYGDFGNEEADDDGSHGVEYRPSLPKEDGATYADGCADAGKRVAAVVPCIGFESL